MENDEESWKEVVEEGKTPREKERKRGYSERARDGDDMERG